jgi:chromatin remodeling complex protein RSC6
MSQVFQVYLKYSTNQLFIGKYSGNSPFDVIKKIYDYIYMIKKEKKILCKTKLLLRDVKNNIYTYYVN